MLGSKSSKSPQQPNQQAFKEVQAPLSVISGVSCQQSVEVCAHQDVLCHDVRQGLVRLQALDEKLVHHQLLAQNRGAFPQSPLVPLQHAALEHLSWDTQVTKTRTCCADGRKEVHGGCRRPRRQQQKQVDWDYHNNTHIHHSQQQPSRAALPAPCITEKDWPIRLRRQKSSKRSCR